MIYRFGPFELDEERGELRRSGEPLAVQPLVLDLLFYLVRHRERVVPKDELLATLWPDAAVTEASLARAVSLARRAVHEDEREEAAIRNVSRRGYRFCLSVETGGGGAEAPADVADGAADGREGAAAATGADAAAAGSAPRVRYTRSGDVHLAYQAFGEGPVDLVAIQGWAFSIQSIWDNPWSAAFYRRLAERARVIVFDKRGTGLSDRVADLPGLEQRMDDLRAVLDAVGSQRAFLLGHSEGGPMSILFAATAPERTAGLLLAGSMARMVRAEDHPAGWSEADCDRLSEYIRTRWGEGSSFLAIMPSLADDPEWRAFCGRAEMLGASPGAAQQLWDMNRAIDVRDALSAVRVPTLVMHATGDEVLDVEQGRVLARGIPKARFVELPGRDHVPWSPETADAVLDAIDATLAADRRGRPADEADGVDSVLATLLCAEIARPAAPGSQARSRAAHALGEIARRFRGRAAVGPPGVLVATFDGPARAIRCADALREALAADRIVLRTGVHTAEVALSGDRLAGTGADIATGVMRHTRPGEIWASRTVRDLVAGSGIAFDPRGEHPLPGTPEPWPLFAVTHC